MSTFAGWHSFLSLWHRAGYVNPLFTSEDLSFSPSNSRPKLPLLCACPVSAATTFLKTKGSYILARWEAAVPWGEGLMLTSNTVFAMPLQVLCAGRNKCLILNCAIMCLMFIWQSTTKSYTSTIKGNNCVFAAQLAAFSPLLMMFVIYSLFYDCFQAFCILESY
jgi:hypothetical protein